LISLKLLREIEIRSFLLKLIVLGVVFGSRVIEKLIMEDAELSPRMLNEFRFFFAPLVGIWVTHFAGRMEVRQKTKGKGFVRESLAVAWRNPPVSACSPRGRPRHPTGGN
jgi:hypothetical protein